MTWIARAAPIPVFAVARSIECLRRGAAVHALCFDSLRLCQKADPDRDASHAIGRN